MRRRFITCRRSGTKSGRQRRLVPQFHAVTPCLPMLIRTATVWIAGGSLMRFAPVTLFYFPGLDEGVRFSGESSLTTHAVSEAIECFKLFGLLLTRVLSGSPKESGSPLNPRVFRETRTPGTARRLPPGPKRSYRQVA
jgi:hypothetical protein